MDLSPQIIVAIVFGGLAFVVFALAIDRSLTGRARGGFRLGLAAVTIGLFFLGLREFVQNYERAVDVTKAMVAIAAASLVFYETFRAGRRRPIAERWKRFFGVALGVVAITCYFNGFKFGYGPYWHRWDQFHYYMGAKYFHEMGYDGLYKCTAIAEDDLGAVDWTDPQTGQTAHLDLSKEVHQPDKKIRNLGGDNLLMPIGDVLEHPERCKTLFSPERWSAFKEDVKFFRMTSDRAYWDDMQKDHGFNPPPVWTILGSILSNLHAAQVRYMQLLASLDIAYQLGMFGLIWWAFGWRIFAVAAILWGCQSPASTYWTAGAFLRQDWLFFLVAAVCFGRKGWHKLAGASLVYAALLRVFPGLAVVGWLVVAGAYLVKHKRLAPSHKQTLIGGVVAAVVLTAASVKIVGGSLDSKGFERSYGQFYHHTLEVHDRTPLTNHMGLRVLVAHNVGNTGASGRAKYTKDPKLTDPFEVWKNMRNARYDKYRVVAYAIIALSLLGFTLVVRRIKSLWIALCLGQVFIILLSQLTCYYYCFVILAAPLTRARKNLEVLLFGFAAVSQFVFWAFYWYDDKYAALTLVSLLFCYALVCAFLPKPAWERFKASIGLGTPPESVEAQ